MNSKPLWIVIIVILIAAGAWYALAGRHMDTAPEQQVATTTGTPNVPAASSLETHTVTYTDAGFSPSSLTIDKGETVRFVNDSSLEMWVAADEHPDHTGYDGTSRDDHCEDGMNTNGSFDQCKRTAKGTSYSYAFTKSGTFAYHNHASSTYEGSITVR